MTVFARSIDGNAYRKPVMPYERDEGGCFRGCRVHGCAATQCRDIQAIRPSRARGWFWFTED